MGSPPHPRNKSSIPGAALWALFGFPGPQNGAVRPTFQHPPPNLFHFSPKFPPPMWVSAVGWGGGMGQSCADGPEGRSGAGLSGPRFSRGPFAQSPSFHPELFSVGPNPLVSVSGRPMNSVPQVPGGAPFAVTSNTQLPVRLFPQTTHFRSDQPNFRSSPLNVPSLLLSRFPKLLTSGQTRSPLSPTSGLPTPLPPEAPNPKPITRSSTPPEVRPTGTGNSAMKLLTHNLLTSHVRGVQPGAGFPFHIRVTPPPNPRYPSAPPPPDSR